MAEQQAAGTTPVTTPVTRHEVAPEIAEWFLCDGTNLEVDSPTEGKLWRVFSNDGRWVWSKTDVNIGARVNCTKRTRGDWYNTREMGPDGLPIQKQVEKSGHRLTYVGAKVAADYDNYEAMQAKMVKLGF